VELSVPLLSLGALWTLGLSWSLLPALWLIPVGVAVAVIDLRTLIVPTRIVWPAFFVSVLLCVVAAGLEGEWDWLLSAIVGMAVLALPLFLIWFAVPHGMGFGDVRLATLLGFNVGFYALGSFLGAVFLSVLCMGGSAVLGVLMGVIALGARGRGAKVPFGPALVAGAFLCIAFAEPIIDALVD
jgi:leader peptidase (prepilin peptidase)/N-methyltransferase